MPRLIGKFVWFECVTSQVNKAKAFYAEVVGWKTKAFPMGKESYEMMIVGDTPVGGYASPEDAAGAAAPSHWTSYVSVNDVERDGKEDRRRGRRHASGGVRRAGGGAHGQGRQSAGRQLLAHVRP